MDKDGKFALTPKGRTEVTTMLRVGGKYLADLKENMEEIMAVQELIKKEITELEAAIAECRRVIANENGVVEENLTEEEKMMMELAFGSMDEAKRLAKEVIAEQEDTIRKAERRIAELKGYLA